MPRNEWTLDRIMEITSSNDGLVRRAKIYLGDPKIDAKGNCVSKPSIIERPVQKLILLIEGN